MELLKQAIFFVALATFASSQTHDPNYCFVTDPIRRQISMFSSRTAYEIQRGGTINAQVSSCTPSKFWMFARHGARLPGTNDIGRQSGITTQHNNIRAAFNAGRSTLCTEDFALIDTWRFDPNITLEKENWLHVSGWNEVKGVAQRFQRAFPTLLPTTYNRNWYRFRNTDRQRTQASIRAFTDGLFGHNGYQQVFVDPFTVPDRLLRPHDDCPLYTAVSSNQVERDAWQTGNEFVTMLNQVNNKFGLEGNQRLTARQCRTIWEICNFEQLWDLIRPAPFCGGFTYANNLVLEYFDDIDYYYNAGFGGPRRLFENLNCHLIQDMLRYLLSTDPNEDRARIYNSHSTAFQLFMVTLGLFEDSQPLRANNFAIHQMRQWRSANIIPMASNLAVIRYDCPNGDNDVLFLMNERPLQIPGCQANGLCKVSTIIQRYNRFLDANCATLSCSNN